mmetsp:Transcript_12284/g.44794  ORF Transcript_12284/g.44794 Transcript_12284/m.44794 type:complete len:275 (+) Transcript_12284:157-981(+)
MPADTAVEETPKGPAVDGEAAATEETPAEGATPAPAVNLAQANAEALSEALLAYFIEHQISEERAAQVAAKLIEHDISGPVLISIDSQKLDKDLSDSALGFEVSSYGMRTTLLQFRRHIMHQNQGSEVPPSKRYRPSHKRRGIDSDMPEAVYDLSGKKPSRRYQKWTPEENDAIRAGVEKHGGCKWAAILSDPEYSEILRARSQGDLSDKWRGIKKRLESPGGRKKPKTADEEAQAEDTPMPPAQDEANNVEAAEEEKPDDKADGEDLDPTDPR